MYYCVFLPIWKEIKCQRGTTVTFSLTSSQLPMLGATARGTHSENQTQADSATMKPISGGMNWSDIALIAVINATYF